MELRKQENIHGGEQAVQQFLTFLIGGEEYAISLLKVREIIEYDVVTKVPRTPEWVRGVINLRGSVVPVVDLAIKFRQAPTEIGKLTCIVIAEVQCEGESTVMGVIVDAVSQVIDLRAEDIEPPPTFGTRVKVDYLLGMARAGKKFCLMLDTDKVLSTDELLELATAAEESLAEAVASSTATDLSADPIMEAPLEASNQA